MLFSDAAQVPARITGSDAWTALPDSFLVFELSSAAALRVLYSMVARPEAGPQADASECGGIAARLTLDGRTFYDTGASLALAVQSAATPSAILERDLALVVPAGLHVLRLHRGFLAFD